MKKGFTVRIRVLVFMLAVILVCGGRIAASVSAAEDVLIETVETGASKEAAAQQDEAASPEDIWLAKDAGAPAGADTENEGWDGELILDEISVSGGEADETVSDGNAGSDEDNDLENVCDNSLILDIEVADDPQYETAEPEAGVKETAAYAKEAETILLEASGDASCASFSRIRAFSLYTYGNSYGEQLSDESLGIYQKMEEVWAAGKTDNLTCTFAAAYTFTAEGTVVYDEAQGKNVAQWDKAGCEGYQDVLLEMKYAVQSAFDAFAYDYPEAFWLGKVTYSYSIGLRAESDTRLRGSISAVTICGTGAVEAEDGSVNLREKYEGAAGETAAFLSAVDVAVDRISSSLPEGADTYDTVKAIHDYICNTVSYGENEYAHTAAGVFHKEPRVVVCEGYAKAVKILCRRFGIPCALIVGSALKSTGAGEDHMWNYVRMDDGNWYMVDTTWDDQADGIRYVYFLAGSSSGGFNAVISEERQLYTCFSGAAYTMSFTLPVLSEKMYHRHTPGDWKTVKEATCAEAGRREQYCTECGVLTAAESIELIAHTWGSKVVTAEATCTEGEVRTYTCTVCGETRTETAAAPGHDYSASWTTDKAATCTASGTKSHHCTRCGSKTDVTEIAAAGHTWDTGKVTKAAACTAAGVKTYTCTVCGETKTETVKALGHDYSVSWTTDEAATCTASGTKSHHCTRCGSKTDVTETAAIGHTWDTGKVTKAAACTAAGIRTYTCKTCKAVKTAKIAAVGHKYGSYVTTRAATVLKAGVQTSTCSRCGGKKTKSVAKLTGTISLNVSSLPLKVGQSAAVVKVTKMSEGDYVKSWKSSNTKVASVTKTGKITGKKAGTATITVTLASGIKDTVRVTVQKTAVKTTKLTVKAKNAVLKSNKMTLKKGAKMSLTVSVTPLTSTDKVVYVSSNKKVVTVSGKGVVQAKGAGTARITVKSGSRKVVITVKVPKVSTASVSGVPARLTVRKGKTVVLKPVLTPMNSDDKITYSSSEKSVAAVGSAGKITAKKKGTAVITVKSGNVKAVCKVTVK